jgi:hypothetical protein
VVHHATVRRQQRHLRRPDLQAGGGPQWAPSPSPAPRGFSGLQLGSLLLGIWLIISPPILDHKHPVAHAMYWSNSFSGGVLIAFAAAGLGFAALRRIAR